MNSKSSATVKARVTMSAKVTRGDSGEYGPPGSVEDLGVQREQIVELTHEQAVQLFGRDEANNLFNIKE